MYYIATYDVGTTAVKGVLVSSDGEIKTSELVQIKTYFQQDYKEQKPDDWFDAFCQIGKKFTSHVGADKIKAVIMSGQMQDLKRGDHCAIQFSIRTRGQVWKRQRFRRW